MATTAVALLILLGGFVPQVRSILVDRAADEYDYIVVGGGTAGSIVAGRLSEDPDVSVLVIEAGRMLNDESDPDYMDLLYYPRFETRQTYVSLWLWPNLTTGPLEGLNGRTGNVVTAKIAGGGAAINGRIYLRGAQRDYNDWAQYLHDDGWSWEGILPYFKKHETFTPPDQDAVAENDIITYDMAPHGVSGPINIVYPPVLIGTALNIIGAEKTLGIPQKEEQASGDIVGGVWQPMASRPQDKFSRSFSKREYYDPVRDRPNLHFLAENTVTKILFDKKKTTGVTYAKGPEAETKTASISKKGEVIVASGSVKSPQILQVSGVGPKRLSEAFGIPSVVDLPVGENYQDHAAINTGYNMTLPFEEQMWFSKTNKTWFDIERDLYINEGLGSLTATSENRKTFLSLPMAHGQKTARALVKQFQQGDDVSQYLRPEASEAYAKSYKTQLKITLASMFTDDIAVDEIDTRGTRHLLVKPLSRGYIEAVTTNIWDPPTINHRTLSHPLDLKNTIASLRFGRRFLATPDFAPLEPIETSPGVGVQTDEQFEGFVRDTMSSGGAHGCCTAAMGPVLDSKLKVRGVKGLRVVDSASWPMIPGSHGTLSTTYAVAEKAADLIKADQSR